MADFQHQADHTRIQNQKTYVPLEQLFFYEDGIFFKSTPGQFVKVEHLGCDMHGYYIAGLFDELFRKPNYVANCSSCGMEYHNRSPQPCEKCNRSDGFDLVYIEESYWDRNG